MAHNNGDPPWIKLWVAAGKAAAAGQWGVAASLGAAGTEALREHCMRIDEKENKRIVANSGKRIAKDDREYWHHHFESKKQADILFKGFSSRGRGDDD